MNRFFSIRRYSSPEIRAANSAYRCVSHSPGSGGFPATLRTSVASVKYRSASHSWYCIFLSVFLNTSITSSLAFGYIFQKSGSLPGFAMGLPPISLNFKNELQITHRPMWEKKLGIARPCFMVMIFFTDVVFKICV